MKKENAKILVVEDEIIVAMEIKSRLESFGYSVPAVVSTGEDAIKKAGESGADLVLMDIMLKGDMDGIEAARQICANNNIPVVFLTAYADDKTLERAKITEPFGYIVKPFEDRELHVAIEISLYKHAIDKKLKENEKWLSAVIKSIGDAVIAIDDKGLVKLMNPFAEALINIKEAEAVGKPLKEVFNIICEETGENVEDPLLKIYREGIFYGLADHTLLITKEGTKVPVDIIGTPILDEKNKIIGTVLVFYDILEHKKTEKSIYRLSQAKQ
jgi:PAS domain S-box-containing protein